MTLTIDRLERIEHEAARAPAIMLRLHLAEVQAGFASASSETRDYACVLLLKLEHLLLRESVAQTVDSQTSVHLFNGCDIPELEKRAA